MIGIITRINADSFNFSLLLLGVTNYRGGNDR